MWEQKGNGRLNMFKNKNTQKNRFLDDYLLILSPLLLKVIYYVYYFVQFTFEIFIFKNAQS